MTSATQSCAVAGHRIRTAAFVALLGVAVAACQGESRRRLGLNQPDPQGESRVSRAPIVIPNPAVNRKKAKGGKLREERELSKEDRGWQEKLALAREYAAGGYDEQALQILDACLTRQPKQPILGQMRALKTSLQLRRTEEKLLRVEAFGVKDYVPFGQDVDFRIRMQNVSNEPITLRPPGSGVKSISPTAISVDVSRTDRDIFATQMQRSWTQNVFLHRPGGRALTIKPGASHEFSMRIPASEVGGTIAGLRILEVGGMLRPTRLTKGKEGRTVRLRVRKGRVVVLPGNYEPVVLDPIKSMRTAVQTGAGQHLLIASEFVPRRSRVEAVEILARALAEGRPGLRRASLGALSTIREHATGARLRPLVEPLMDVLEMTAARSEAVMEGIAALSDVRLAPDPRLWRDWWDRDLDEDTRVPPPGGQPTDEVEEMAERE